MCVCVCVCVYVYTCVCSLALGNCNGLAVVDYLQKTVLLCMSTLELYGPSDPFQRLTRSPRMHAHRHTHTQSSIGFYNSLSSSTFPSSLFFPLFCPLPPFRHPHSTLLTHPLLCSALLCSPPLTPTHPHTHTHTHTHHCFQQHIRNAIITVAVGNI